MSKLFGASLLTLIFLFPLNSQAEKQKVSKIVVPHFISVDRRPDKDLVYSRCVGLFRSDEGRDTNFAAVKAAGDRICPEPGSIILDAEKVPGGYTKITSDDGESIAYPADFKGDDFDKKADYKGKQWHFSMVPSQVTIRKGRKSDGTWELSDSFCIGMAIDDNDDETFFVACNTCATLKACFESSLQPKKPLPDPKKTEKRTSGVQLGAVVESTHTLDTSK